MSIKYLTTIEDELLQYNPPLTKEADFDSFWEESIRIGKNNSLNLEKKVILFQSDYVRVYDITYCGYDATPVHGWIVIPNFSKQENYPCIIQYPGFGGNCGQPWEVMHWAMMGIAVLSIDCRDQGGKTGNLATYCRMGQVTNVMTKGLLDKKEFYLRAVYIDCLQAFAVLERFSEINTNAVGVRGTSQGGGIGMAICALEPRIKFGICNVPSNSDLVSRVKSKTGSFKAISDYLKIFPENTDIAFETLSYFDTMNMAEKIDCSIFASVGLEDIICPPKMYFASYNRIKSQKEIKIYPFGGHGDVERLHMNHEMDFVKQILKIQ